MYVDGSNGMNFYLDNFGIYKWLVASSILLVNFAELDHVKYQYILTILLIVLISLMGIEPTVNC